MSRDEFQNLKDEIFLQCQKEFADDVVKSGRPLFEKYPGTSGENIKNLLVELTFITSTKSFEAAVRYFDTILDKLSEAFFE